MAGTINWKRVAHSTLHPLQVEILEAIADRDRMSPVQFDGSDAPSISRVAYHFRALQRAGLLDPAGTVPKRGATEHFYRLAPRARG